MLVGITMPYVCRTVSSAKYAASTPVPITPVRAAKWNPFDKLGYWYDEGEPQYYAEDGSGESVVVVSAPGAVAHTTEATLRNNGEVAARYKLMPTVDEVNGSSASIDTDAFLAQLAITVKSADFAPLPVYDPGDGIVIPCGKKAVLYVTFPAVCFKGLHINVLSAQVD